ncbi:MAG: histidinol-phosphatase [Neolewinella sp.]|jgi:histidinol-phosphatase
MPPKVLFLDRDGTLILEPADYQVDHIDKLNFYPGVFRWLGRIVQELDYTLVMVTNQDGLGTDSYPEENFWPTHNAMLRALEAEGITFSEQIIDRTFAADNQPTRKPGTELVKHYMTGEYDLANSYVVGDRLTDIKLAENMGAKGIWIANDPELGAEELSPVQTGHALSPDALSPDAPSPDALSPDALSPDAPSPDALSPDAPSPDALSPDALSPDALSPDAASPDAASPDAASPDALSPDAPSPVQTGHALSLLSPQETLQGTIALRTTDWEDIYRLLRLASRTASVRRTTKETDIQIELDLDGTGKTDMDTGLGFFDHMLDQLGRHSGCDLSVKVKGDLHIDEHHTIEDTAIALGEAFGQALGDKLGIERYGFNLVMDESIVDVRLDFGGRQWLVWDCEYKREKVGDMPTEMFHHFFKSFSDGAKCNLAIKAEGNNEHHMIEATFKALAKSIKAAKRRDVDNMRLPSTKGIL